MRFWVYRRPAYHIYRGRTFYEGFRTPGVAPPASTYSQAIADLNPEHHWDFDGDSLDQIGSINGTDTSILYTSLAIAKDATNCAETNAFTDRIVLGSSGDINNSSQDRKAFCGWYTSTTFMAPPMRIYGEGDNLTTFQIVMGYGNNLMAEVVEPISFATGLQIYGPAVVPNRVYHLCAIFLGNTQGNEFKFFVDGIEQILADPIDRQPDTINLNSRTSGIFADPSGTTGVGGDVILQQAAINGKYSHWASWGDTANANLSDTQVREILFEQGALAEQTISTGTEAAMQTSLDALVDQPNAACCIEVEGLTGGGDFQLTSNIQFDSLASIHVRNNGTGTLTWVNVAGSPNTIGNASIVSAPFGGSVIIATRQTLTITVLDATTFAPLEGVQVYIEADTGGDLVLGTLIMKVLTDSSGVATETFDYTNDQPIVARVRRGTSTPLYITNIIGGPLTSIELNETVLMVPDE